MSTQKHTLVLGASANPQRYSFLAINKLTAHGHPVSAVGLREGQVGNVPLVTGQPALENVDTITLYLSAANQRQYYDYILSLHPKRIIFNPGAENPELEELAIQHQITPLDACTLVMLSTGQY